MKRLRIQKVDEFPEELCYTETKSRLEVTFNMETRVLKIEENDLNEALLKEAGAVLRAGGLVAFPTETVYGLGGDALNRESSKKIYAAKGRPSADRPHQ